MRTTTALAVLALGLPALPAGAAASAHGSIDALNRPGIGVVLRPGSSAVPARRFSPAAAQGTEQPARGDADATGSITMEARQLQGAEAIAVQGSAPAGAPVTITLLAVVSSELPTIVVSRHDVVTDANGRFEAIIPIASAYERGTLLRVVATSSSGIASAQSQLITQAPNDGVTVPLEQSPH
jgi:hypothetical protein